MDLFADYQWLSSAASFLLPQTPFYLVYLVGLVTALVRWRFHPRISFYTVTAIAISLVTSIVLTVVQATLPYYLIRLSSDSQTFAYYYFALNVISNLIHAFAFALILLAIFSERSNVVPNRAI